MNNIGQGHQLVCEPFRATEDCRFHINVGTKFKVTNIITYRLSFIINSLKCSFTHFIPTVELAVWNSSQLLAVSQQLIHAHGKILRSRGDGLSLHPWNHPELVMIIVAITWWAKSPIGAGLYAWMWQNKPEYVERYGPSMRVDRERWLWKKIEPSFLSLVHLDDLLSIYCIRKERESRTRRGIWLL